jgi:hypothetical protein
VVVVVPVVTGLIEVSSVVVVVVLGLLQAPKDIRHTAEKAKRIFFIEFFPRNPG